MRPINSVRGFTLIEMMVVMAIMGILVAIALPLYSDHLLKSKLAEGHSALMDWRLRQEQYFQDNRTYVSAGTTCGAAAPTSVKYWDFSCTGDANTYVATATSKDIVGGAAGDYTYTINENNVRTTTKFTGASGLPKSCWISSKTGTC